MLNCIRHNSRLIKRNIHINKCVKNDCVKNDCVVRNSVKNECVKNDCVMRNRVKNDYSKKLDIIIQATCTMSFVAVVDFALLLYLIRITN